MVDYLIVGQGIAGSVLAWQLLKAGQSILVFNNSLANQASQIAAGLYNPVTGRHLATTWLAERLFPSLEQFYREVENKLGVKLLYPYPIFRPFLGSIEQAAYLERGLTEGFPAYVEPVYRQDVLSPFENLYGGLFIRQAGYLDIPLFLQAIRIYLEKLGCYREHQFDYSQLQLGSSVQYQAIQAKGIIFCEGPQAKQNPFFSNLPFRLVKGELLTIQLDQDVDIIYNRGIYIVPKPGKQAIVGPTYDWQDLSIETTIKAKTILEETLKQRLQIPYQVIAQKAGIRPATFDRRPFIGTHPDYVSLHIFNGLGTKGVSLAPYWAEQFVNYLLLQQKLSQEVSLSRLVVKD